MSDQPRITYNEITCIQKSINDAINSQINVCQRIQALRHEIQADREIFIEQLRSEIEKARAELREETRIIHQRMLSEVSIAATELLRDATIKSIRGESLDQSGPDESESADQSEALNQEKYDEEQNK